MAYTKKNWIAGEKIRATALNNIETGIETNDTDIEDLKEHFPDTGKFVAGSGSASANYAVAEGRDTTASGIGSHAEGRSVVASGQGAHAEGGYTTASGDYSHSEGSNYSYVNGGQATSRRTGAGGQASHAEGRGTYANGVASHSEGSWTTATHANQHVFGEFNSTDTSNAASTERGTYVEIVGNGTGPSFLSNARTLDWSGNERLAGGLTLGAGTADETSITASELSEIKSGGSGTTDYADLTNKPQIAGTTLSGDKSLDDLGIAPKANPVLTGSISLGRKASTAVGSNSVALGETVEASGNNSHAEGYRTTASGTRSHAEGESSVASGNNSHAEGRSSTASGDSSHAEGRSTATGAASHSEGTSTTNGLYAHSEGGATEANGYYSHSEGLATIASRQAQHVFGKYNVADVSGADTTALGDYVEIVGNGTGTSDRSNARTLDWSGNERLAGGLTLGAGTANETSITASELADIKSGGSGTTDYTDLTNKPQIAGTTLTGNKSLDDLGIAAKNNAEFTGTLSKGRKANTIAGTYSTAIGYDVEASGNYAVAMGYGTVSSGTHSFAEGSFATASASYSHAEGRNTNATAISSHAEGNGTTASAQYCHAEGDQTTASRNASHAEGASTSAEGTASHSEGGSTVANGNYSHAAGFHTAAYGKSTHVFGEYNTYSDSASRSSRSTYVEIVGNGTADDARSNARTLDWNGNESLAGSLTLGMGTADETSITAAELAALKSGSGGGGGSITPVDPSGLYVTPEMYGATGNGTTDDSNAMSQAFNSGLPVVLTKGKTYFMMQATITHPLVVYGNFATIKTRSITDQEYSGGLHRMLIFDDSATQVYMQDVNFYTNGDQTIYGAHGDRDDPIPNRSMRNAISCYGVDKIVLNNCKFENFDDPILGQRHGEDSTYQYICKNAWFLNLQIHNSLMGIIGQYKNIVIDGCEIIEDANARSGEHGIYLIMDSMETCNITNTRIYTYNGSCGSCIQFYPSSLSAALPTVDKREYIVNNCTLIGDAYISNAGGGNVYAKACVMKTINYNTDNRRRQFECAIGNGTIEVSDSNINLELQDGITQYLVFRNCSIYSNRITSDRFAIYKAYECQFDNISARLADGAECINCTFASSIGVLGRYYLTVPNTTTNSIVMGCIFRTGTNVNSIIYGCVGTCLMVDIISSLPTGSDNTGLVLRHKIDPGTDDTTDEGTPSGSGSSSINAPRIEGNRLLLFTGAIPSDGYALLFQGSYRIQKDAGDDYSYIYNNNIDMTINDGDMFKVTWNGEETELTARSVTINSTNVIAIGNPGVISPLSDDGSGLKYIGYMYRTNMVVFACEDTSESRINIVVKKKVV